MLEELLAKPESKTMEFKENAQSIQKIVQTVIAFANTPVGPSLLESKGILKKLLEWQISLKMKSGWPTLSPIL